MTNPIDMNSKYTHIPVCILFALIVALCSGTPVSVQAQSPTSFGKRVLGLPSSYLEPNEWTNTTDKQPKSKLPWIVFSDRAQNTTTTSPGGSLMMEELSFLEPFYVSEEKDGYVKLLRYSDNMVTGLKLKNKKTAESVGWIAKDKLLLWQKSYVDPQSHFADKFLTIINDVDPLVQPNNYFDRQDSIYVYDGPDLKNKQQKITLHNYVYIFKRSANGKQYLIGTSDQFVTRHAEEYIKGWVSAALVEKWGSRLYVTPRVFADPEVNQAVQTLNSYTKNSNAPYRIDPLLDTTNIMLNGLPLRVDMQRDLSVPLALDVFSKDNNRLLTINGSEMTYPAFLNLIKNRSKVNIVFVVDGGGTMKSHFSSLLNTIQSFENTINAVFNPRSVQYGSIVYRHSNGCPTGMGRLPLTTDYRKLTAFMRDQAVITADCNASNDRQPLFAGLEDAIGLVADIPQQTNLFVVIGSTGNVGGSNAAQISALARRIADVDGRLLMMQSHNLSASGFTDFIAESRQLVSREAYYAAEQRKYQLVEGEAFGQQDYDFNLTDSISYYLDFPNASLVQGGVVFPSRGATLQSKSYQAGFSRFLNETRLDITKHLSSLDSAFRLTGIENRNVSDNVRNLLRDKFNAQVGDQMPHNVFKFASQVQVSPTILDEHASNGLEFNLVLNQNEYNDLLDVLHILVGGNLQGDDPQFRKKLYKNYGAVFLERRGRKIPSGELNNWTLNTYMQKLLGIPHQLLPFENYTVKSLNNTRQMSLREFELYITYLRETIATVKTFAQGEGKFRSNGETYYRIPGRLFRTHIAQDDDN